ncbi:AbrB/MazE/SpoVT family DNA-binding domain-containing protein [Candidatus Methanodesulfokora washburnensis]|jgi:AbrB family looped-hinge helix DNA binding protein|uniref:AbrB/MazE/SpoVT family DNA-binding domain-containing protein n=1 Tax=Candidatus Methanodesulfokora washburnensis TaxID=2478471 RepID=A0A3R9R4D5_9CREN|nr:AbrB/MazE/SpoVT family DNA-binding domain-containing protein [Candidatus Methanodesulfokores washburnensis]RSN79119.1 AbrB/MazE/SpoVT family DNA-binding domain-containing protein [Candidatus Methanodesulfokores washburnensis]
MTTEVVRIDKKGRLLIPKKLREKAGIEEGGLVKLRAEERGIIIEPVESVADKYFGAFKVERWPDDLDEFLIRVMKEWWAKKDM